MHKGLPTIDVDGPVLEFLDRAVSMPAYAFRHMVEKLQRVPIGEKRRSSNAADRQ